MDARRRRRALDRSRQFKILVSNDEWERLVDVAEIEQTSASDVIRSFIGRKHAELMRPATKDLHRMADALAEIARTLLIIAEHRKAPR